MVAFASSYGPLGKSKLVANSSGTLVVTKDYQQLISHELQMMANSADRKLFEICLQQAVRSGDGSFTYLQVWSSLHDSLKHFLNTSYNESCIPNHTSTRQISWNHRRLHILRATQAFRYAIYQLREDITSYHTDKGLWRSEQLWEDWAQHICLNLLVPASNAHVAQSISAVVISWLFKFVDETSFNARAPKMSGNLLASLCRYFLDHINVLLFTVITKTDSAPRVPLHLLSNDEILIRGRCRDISALGNLRRDCKLFKFVCIDNILGSDTNVANRNSALHHARHTLRLGSHNSLASLAVVGLASLQSLVHQLKEYEVSVIVCGCSVEAEALRMVAHYGIDVIDNVPTESLEYICHRSNSKLYDIAAATLDMRERGFISSGSFSYLKRTTFGVHRELGLFLIGVLPMCDNRADETFVEYTNKYDDISRIETSVNGGIHRQQIVIESQSTLTAGTYYRLLERSFKALAYAADCTNCCYTKSNIKHVERVLVPGGGAAEMGWALLWECVARAIDDIISNRHQRDESGSGSDTNQYERNWCGIYKSSEYQLPLPLPHFQHSIGLPPTHQDALNMQSKNNVSSVPLDLPERIAQVIIMRLPTTDLLNARQACLALCSALRDAYLQIPSQHVRNAVDVLELSTQKMSNNFSNSDEYNIELYADSSSNHSICNPSFLHSLPPHYAHQRCSAMKRNNRGAPIAPLSKNDRVMRSWLAFFCPGISCVNSSDSHLGSSVQSVKNTKCSIDHNPMDMRSDASKLCGTRQAAERKGLDVKLGGIGVVAPVCSRNLTNDPTDDDVHADDTPVCFLGDAFSNGVCGSNAHFWAGFDTALDNAIIYLRVGGANPILSLRRKRVPS